MDTIIEKKKWTKKRISSLSLIVLVAILLVYFLFIRRTHTVLHVDKSHLLIAEVAEGSFMEYIPVDGTVYPKNTVYIDAVLGGIVEEIFVEDGDTVTKGSPLLKLQNTEMELRFMEQETRIFDAINNLQNTKLLLDRDKYTRQKEIVDLQYKSDKLKAEFDRKQSLFKQNAIAIKEYEDVKREYVFNKKQLAISMKLARIDSLSYKNRNKQIMGSIARMYENVDLLKKSMDNLVVKSPADGKLSSFKLELGQTKSPGEHLAQIDQLGGNKLLVKLDERYISRVRKGQSAEFISENNKILKLFVSKIYTDVVNGSFQVEMLFDSKEPEHIKRGQNLQVRLILSEAENALMIKRGAFFQATGGNWIYVLSADGKTATKRAIKTGRQNVYNYEITEGLKPGEKVIVSSYGTFGDSYKLEFE
jgi:HlyD family secretion protein